jgi:uncharacterized protein YcbK (DUF882 family)
VTYQYFSKEEFACSETGENNISHEFLLELDKLRDACGFPFYITSGYRSPDHSLEGVKVKPGTHAEGIAADIYVKDGIERRKIVEEAIKLGFGGIGVAKTFVHVDIRATGPVMWTY